MQCDTHLNASVQGKFLQRFDVSIINIERCCRESPLNFQPSTPAIDPMALSAEHCTMVRPVQLPQQERLT